MGDIFLTVSPGLTNVWVANAEATRQITSRRDAFPKPLTSYKIREKFGNILSTEGVEWKQHRKVSSPSFNEKNNVLVFSEACGQTQDMLRKWTGIDGKGNITINEVPADTDRLTLHIISNVGFGKRLMWPGEKRKEGESSEDVYSSEIRAGGHTMSFENSLYMFLEKLLWVLLTPK
jgi:cytochrome P450